MKRATILMADDSATVRIQLQRALEGQGHEVVIACDGREAVTKIQERPPDLAILDITMPELDGYEVCQQIKRMGLPWSRVPIIFLTSSASHALELLGEQWGAYVPKPVSVKRLLEVTTALLEPTPATEDDSRSPTEGPPSAQTAEPSAVV